nr:ATP-binding cassette domain-containing protein [Angustibacter aerolatus]
MPHPADDAVVVRGLVRTYGSTRAVDGLDLDARAGEVTAVLGPNGAGKTTTVECLEGLRRPTSGTVRVLGRDPWRADAGHRAAVGVMLQDGGLPNGARALPLLQHVARFFAHPLDVGEPGRAARPRRVRRHLGAAAQRRAAAAAGAGAGRGRPPPRAVPRRAERRARPAGPAVGVGARRVGARRRRGRAAHHAPDGRGGAAGRPGRRRRRRAGRGQRLPRRPHRLRPGRDRAVPCHAAARPDGAARRPAARRRGRRARPGEYVVHGAVDPRVLSTLTAWCAARQVMPEGLTVGRRSLEDVFLDLTGRALR